MKPTEVVINDTVFLISRMDAFDALAAFGDLQKDVLPAVGGLFGAMSDDDSKSEAAMGEAIANLSAKLDGKQLKYWCDRLLTKDSISVEINGTLQPLDAAVKSMVFHEFTDILELLFHVVKVNFAGPLVSWLNRAGLGQSLSKSVQSALTAKK